MWYKIKVYDSILDIDYNTDTPKTIIPINSENAYVNFITCNPSETWIEVDDEEVDTFIEGRKTNTSDNYEPEPIPDPQPTQADRIEENQLILMEAMATQYEESLENRLNDQEVQATIYETLLEMQGGN